MEPTRKSVAVRVPKEEYELLRQHAERVSRTMVQVLSRAIRSYCQPYTQRES